MIDDLLLQEVFSLRQKVLILAELLAKHEPELCASGLLHDIGTEDYQDYRISTKSTEQPTSEEACKAALRACLEALEVAQGYVESSGWTRHRDADIAQVESAITNARKALGRGDE